jgi:hypothetical protein
MRDDPKRRQAHWRDGSLKFMGDDRLVAGPFTVETQMEMLGRLKRLEAETGIRLVGDYEENRIRRIWADDALANLDRARGRVSP